MDIETLYQDYFSVVYKYVLSISKDSLTAEEITQETFFKALKKINEFRGESSIKAWLCQIAKNTYFDLIRRRGKYDALPDEYEDPRENVETTYAKKEDAMAIHRILHRLPDPYKEVFSLRAFGELSFSDIGELFGKSDSWARVTYCRAKLKIKEEYEHG